MVGETPTCRAPAGARRAQRHLDRGDNTPPDRAKRSALEALPPQFLKGFGEPVEFGAWLARASWTAASRPTLLASRLFFGTGSGNCADLGPTGSSRWKGEGQVVLLSGEPGIGKSRITRAVLEQVEPGRPVRLRYQCSPYYTNTAFSPIIDQLERAAGFTRDDTALSKLDKLEALLSQGTAQPREVVPLIRIPSLHSNGAPLSPAHLHPTAPEGADDRCSGRPAPRARRSAAGVGDL